LSRKLQPGREGEACCVQGAAFVVDHKNGFERIVQDHHDTHWVKCTKKATKSRILTSFCGFLRAVLHRDWCRDQGSGVRDQRSEVRGQRSEVRGQRSEIRGQRSEIRGQGNKGTRGRCSGGLVSIPSFKIRARTTGELDSGTLGRLRGAIPRIVRNRRPVGPLALFMAVTRCGSQPALGWKGFAPNTQVSPREKLISEQHTIAIPFAANKGSRASPTRAFIKARFPANDTMPFDRWKRMHCPNRVDLCRRARQV